MKLLHLTIHNFRGILDASIALQNYSLLVGANNGGKSTVIDAIRAFYEKDGFKFKKENDFPIKGATDKESWIDLTFQLRDNEHDSLKESYQNSNKTLKVRKYFLTDQKQDDDKTSMAGSIYGYLTDGSLQKEAFYGAKNVQSGKFGDIIYIPAVSKVDEHTKLSGPSALRDLITNIMTDVVDGSTAYNSLSDSVSAFATSVREIETVDHRSLCSFETDFNAMLSPWQTQFHLNFSTPSTGEIIKSMVKWDVCDQTHGKPQDVEYFGSGFQRHFIYSLIRLGAKYMPQKLSKKAKDFTPTLSFVLFEEPEAFLHPPQQDDLARNLVQVGDAEDWQVLCTTHSAHFVSRNAEKIPAIARLQRNAGVVESYQIDDAQWQTLVNSNQAIAAIAAKYQKMQNALVSDDFKPEMEAVKYFLWLNPDRAGLFFSRHVLLVEGPSETALIGKLRDDQKLKTPDGVYVLDCLGKYNIHRFMGLLSALGIDHSVLHDDDDSKGEHRELNQLVVDSTNAKHTKAIRTIPKDLETMLGIPTAGSPHRKPQHVLFQYSTGQMDAGKLQSFCKLVESCFI